LALKIGTKQSAIARLESGKGNPTLGLLEKITQALGARMDIRIG
jgi:predicted transcriptional regulator